jgi:hypothetical protein
MVEERNPKNLIPIFGGERKLIFSFLSFSFFSVNNQRLHNTTVLTSYYLLLRLLTT